MLINVNTSTSGGKHGRFILNLWENESCIDFTETVLFFKKILQFLYNQG